MGVFTIVELEQIKREVTDKVEQEFELFLTKFEESFKKRKEDLVEVICKDLVEVICKDVIEAICKDITTKFNNQIDTLHKEIKVEMSNIEQGIYLDIDRIVNNIE